jgi:hypothetical protein
LTPKSVDWLGVSGRPARMASALALASAAAAFEAAAAAAALPWSIAKDGASGADVGFSCADAVGMPAAMNSKTVAAIRISQAPGKPLAA